MRCLTVKNDMAKVLSISAEPYKRYADRKRSSAVKGTILELVEGYSCCFCLWFVIQGRRWDLVTRSWFKACGVLDDSAKFSVVNLGVLF